MSTPPSSFALDLGTGSLKGSGFTKSVLGILFTFWVMGFLIFKQKGSFFLPWGTGIKFRRVWIWNSFKVLRASLPM